MPDCKHDTCRTEYCPHCGEKIVPLTDIERLRRHVASVTQKALDHAAKLAKKQASPSLCARADHNAAKWTSWLAALDKLIQQQGTSA